MAKLIKLAKMAGVMHESDHAYSIRSTVSYFSAIQQKLFRRLFNAQGNARMNTVNIHLKHHCLYIVARRSDYQPKAWFSYVVRIPDLDKAIH